MSVNVAFGNWLSGYIDGEGSFVCHLSPRGDITTHMVVSARADEKPLLDQCALATGLGRLYYTPAPQQGLTAAPQWRWTVFSIDECQALVDLLAEYPLRSKKSRDLALWAQIITERKRLRGLRGPRRDLALLRQLSLDLRSVRQYDSKHEPPSAANNA